MWGLFIGMALGALQIVALRLIGGKLLGNGKAWVKALAAFALAAKIALIVYILYLLYTASLTHLIWAAGGMLLGLIIASVVMIMLRKRADRKDNRVD